MSRRSRKRSGGGSGSKWVILLVVLLVVLVVATGVIQTLLRRYLHSDEFRIFLSQKTSEAIGVDGAFDALEWDGLAVDSRGFEGVGSQALQKIKVEGLHTEVDLGGFWRGVWEIKGLRARRLELDLNATGEVGFAMPPERREPRSKWLPREVEIQHLQVADVVLRAQMKPGPASLTGMRLQVAPATVEDAYDVELLGGDLVLPYESLPKIKLERAALNARKGRVFLSELKASAWDKGRIDLSGEWDQALGSSALQGRVSGVSCREVLEGDWLKRLSGELESDLQMVFRKGGLRANGHMVLKNGILKGLPALDALAAYADTERFRMLNFSEAHADWIWRQQEWAVRNLVLGCDGLLRLEGNMTVRDGQLDGLFRLGLAPGSLATIPGAEKHVFVAGERGLRWATIRVTGTLEDPQNDLMAQLFDAAGRRMIELLPELSEDTIRELGGLLNLSTDKMLDEGVKGLDGVLKAIEKNPGLLDGILGGGLPR